ncbi:MAG TPA: hypothetical protein VF268_03020 [Gammaproteobacteria bacterium]|jgi:hypothetical protein
MKTLHALSDLDPGVLLPAGGFRLPDLPAIGSSGAETSWALVEESTLYALCSIWLDRAPVYKDYNCSALGHFFAVDKASGRAILEYAFDRLREHGKDYVIGPMNGNTWQSYRFITEDSGHPRFFLEPDSDPLWPEIFADSGFSRIAEYSSALSERLDYRDDSTGTALNNIRVHNLKVRPFDLERSEAELEAVYRLSLKSFAANFLYTGIGRAEFMRLYQKIIPYVVPDYFQLIEDNGELAAYVFAIPDYAQQARGEHIDTLILKTVARAPDKKYTGLGNYLVYYIHQLALRQGFKKIIHALMHESNVSRKISDKSALTIRRYSLYGREL